MNIKEPCFIDISHWDIPAWDELDARVVGVITKASQGRAYVDPTLASSWAEAKRIGRARSAYHFMEYDDAAKQAENFLTACEGVGAIAGGKWMGEIEPILDAEVDAPTADLRLARNGDFNGRMVRETKFRDDLRTPNLFLTKSAAFLPKTPQAFTAAQLAAYYKAWLDIIEAELGLRPIIYTSKWKWAAAGSPAWIADYEVWTAQYPLYPDDHNEPLYLPMGAKTWWGWQYSDRGTLDGFLGDVNLFNGTMDDWIKRYGGGAVVPPPPPGESKMNEIGSVVASALNVRNGPGGTVIAQGFLKQGDLIRTSAVVDGWLRLEEIRRAGIGVGLPGDECWCFRGDTGGYVRREFEFSDSGTTPELPTLTISGEGYNTVQMVPK